MVADAVILVSTLSALVLGLDTRINVGIGQIHQQHHDAERDCQEDDAALDHGIVAAVHGRDHVGADAGNREYLLNDKRTAEHMGQVAACDGDDRDQGVWQRVAVDDLMLRNTLGTRGRDVVGTDNLQHGAARLTCLCGNTAKGVGNAG